LITASLLFFAISFSIRTDPGPDLAAEIAEMYPARQPRIPFGAEQQALARRLLREDGTTILLIGDSWADRCPLCADTLAFPGKPIPKIKDAILARPKPQKQYDIALIMVGIAHMQKTHATVAETREEVRGFAIFVREWCNPKTILAYDPAHMLVLLADQSNRSDGAHLNSAGYERLLFDPHFLSLTLQ